MTESATDVVAPPVRPALPSFQCDADADTSAHRIGHIRALTCIRGIAAWWVVLFHFREALPAATPSAIIAFASHGYLAVDLFFELSGFVIALGYAERIADRQGGRIAQFIMLRFARTYPLHLATLLLFLINVIAILAFSTQKDPGERFATRSFLLNIALIQNWGFTKQLTWNIPAWSISTEWFAYLVFPALALGVCRFRPGSWRILLLAGLLLAALAAAMSATGRSLGDDIARLGLLRCLLEFGAGMCVLRFRAGRSMQHLHEGDAASLCALGCFAVYAMLPTPDYVAVPAGFLCAIYALSDPHSLASRLIATRLLEYVGTISYSTYLIHYFVKDWVKMLLVRPGIPQDLPILIYLCAVALASAWLYRHVEKPGSQAVRSFMARV